jgi:predicted deacylase
MIEQLAKSFPADRDILADAILDFAHTQEGFKYAAIIRGAIPTLVSYWILYDILQKFGTKETKIYLQKAYRKLHREFKNARKQALNKPRYIKTAIIASWLAK